MGDTDREAIAKLKSRDISGLESLVLLYQRHAVNLAALITLDRDLAEDVVSECFLTVYRRIETFDDSRAFRPWFFKIVTHTALKAIHIQDRQISWDDISFAEDWLDNLVIPDHSTADPRTLAEQSETRGIIQAALGGLTAKQRAVIYLRFYCDLGESEMASLLKIPGGTVKSRLSAALNKLRQWFSRDGGPSGYEMIGKG